MASLHIFRRDHVFWWRRFHPICDGRKLDIRLSLKTSDRIEASRRGAALTFTSQGVMEMLDQRSRDERGPTESELKAIAKDAYERLLAELCREQRSTPYHASQFSMSNLALANYYQTLADNGGHSSMLLEEEQRLAEAGWNAQQIEDQKVIIKLRQDEDLTRFQPDYLDGLLRDHSFIPNAMLRWVVELALYPAFRDAHLDAEASLASQLSTT